MLGLGDVVPRGEDPALMGNNLPTVNLGTDRTAVQMATSYESTCAILDNGKAKCWGSGESGKHGRGDTQHYGARSAEMGDNLPYLDLGLGRTVTKIVGAGSGYCALLENERVKCWGYNSAGQLGQGDTETRGDEPNEMGDNLPYIDLGTNAQGQAYAVKNIAAGSFAACAVLENGRLKCWGGNYSGELGLGHTTKLGAQPGEMGNNLPFVDIGTDAQGTPLTVKAISMGHRSTCVVTNEDRVKCWGRSYYGNLGYGNNNSIGSDPNQMGNNLQYIDLGTNDQGEQHTVKQISLNSESRCALLDDDRVKCWGKADRGELGQGNTVEYGDEPNEMGNNLPYVDLGSNITPILLSSAPASTCALFDNGRVKCWGTNANGYFIGYPQYNYAVGDEPGETGDDLDYVDLVMQPTTISGLSGFTEPIPLTAS